MWIKLPKTGALGIESIRLKREHPPEINPMSTRLHPTQLNRLFLLLPLLILKRRFKKKERKKEQNEKPERRFHPTGLLRKSTSILELS
jgi:hypothetical protein